MFFFLSKTFIFLIQPVNWLVALLLFACFTKNQHRRKIAVVALAAGVVLLTNPFIFNTLIKTWEVETDHVSSIFNEYDAAILMGGAQSPDLQSQPGGEGYSMQATRLSDALELYRKGLIKKIILLNGPLDLGENFSQEAAQTKDFLLRVGVPEEDLILLTTSRNTHEHATETANYLQQNMPGAKCLLLTSAWNMRRARGCFLKENVDVTPLSTEYFSQQDWQGILEMLLPDSLGFYKWGFFLKEIFGYLTYWARGFL